MFFKLQHTVTDGVANCTLELLRVNSYVNRTLANGKIIKARNEDDIDLLGVTTFSVSIPEDEPRVFRCINRSPEMETAKQYLINELENAGE